MTLGEIAVRHPGISLQTHVDDVLGLIDAEELRDVVLIGHSYGGMVITGVADTLLGRGPGRLRQLVYLDAMVPLPGAAVTEMGMAGVSLQTSWFAVPG